MLVPNPSWCRSLWLPPESRERATSHDERCINANKITRARATTSCSERQRNAILSMSIKYSKLRGVCSWSLMRKLKTQGSNRRQKRWTNERICVVITFSLHFNTFHFSADDARQVMYNCILHSSAEKTFRYTHIQLSYRGPLRVVSIWPMPMQAYARKNFSYRSVLIGHIFCILFYIKFYQNIIYYKVNVSASVLNRGLKNFKCKKYARIHVRTNTFIIEQRSNVWVHFWEMENALEFLFTAYTARVKITPKTARDSWWTVPLTCFLFKTLKFEFFDGICFIY